MSKVTAIIHKIMNKEKEIGMQVKVTIHSNSNIMTIVNNNHKIQQQ